MVVIRFFSYLGCLETAVSSQNGCQLFLLSVVWKLLSSKNGCQ